MTGRAETTGPPRVAGGWLALVVALLALTGCGADDPKPGPEVAGGNAGIDDTVSAHVKLLDVELAYPRDGRYAQGDDATLRLAISNTGPRDDALVAISGDDFAAVAVDTPSGGLPIRVPSGQTVFVGAAGPPAIQLENLDRSLRSSERIPVTFRFEHAGALTVKVPVAAERQS